MDNYPDTPLDTNTDERFMRLALGQADIAEHNGDVPIGCVVVHEGTRPSSRDDLHEAGDGPGDREGPRGRAAGRIRPLS